MTDRQTQIKRRVSLPAYLAELAVLVGRKVMAEELLSVEDTQSLRKKLRITGAKARRIALRFAGRKSSAFAALVDQLHSLNGSSVVLWIPGANDCGALPLPSLHAIDFGFPFDWCAEGVLVIATSDGLDRMLLDLSEEDGSQSLEMELFGPHWGQASLPVWDSSSAPTDDTL